MFNSIKRNLLVSCAIAAVCTGGVATRANAADLDAGALLQADQNPNDWVMYHQSYKAWRYSSLDQINASNVKNLKIVGMHTPVASKRGVQSTPLAIDGVIYYTTAGSQIWAVDGATGKFLWTNKPKLDQERVDGTIYNPYNRGVAAGYGNIYVGTADGRLIAVDMKAGKEVWATTPIEGNKGFTGAPMVVKDKVMIGSTGGEYSGCCGPIIAVDAKTGKSAWQFDTVGGDERSKASWKKDSWKTGGGGGWMPGNFDAKTNTIFWGTANPAPDYDWGGDKWQTEGARPGENLYSSSVVALDADTGKLKSYFQENPHDAWDFDSASGELVMITRAGKDYLVHPNKGGYVFVYNRAINGDKLKIENVWHLGKTSNFVKGVDPKTGDLIGRRNLVVGMNKMVCPAIDGAISFNSGSYSPETGLYYKTAQEWCADIDVQQAPPPKEYAGQLYLGASFTAIPPPGRSAAFGHVSGRDPITGKVTWEVEYKYPPLGSLLSTKGNLLFVPGADGMLDALDAKTGDKLWSHNNGVGHNGGIISYSVKGKQYIAVVTGFGSHTSGNFGPMFGEPFKSMSGDSGQLLIFGL